MNHQTVKHLLLALRENTLGPAVIQEIRAHVVFCEECQKLYEQWIENS